MDILFCCLFLIRLGFGHWESEPIALLLLIVGVGEEDEISIARAGVRATVLTLL